MSVSKSQANIVTSIGGSVIDYVEFTAGPSVAATTEATANTVVTSNPVTFDGSTEILVEYFSPISSAPNVSSANMTYVLYDNGSSIGKMGFLQSQAAIFGYEPVSSTRKLTPSAGSHTYSIRAYVSSGSGQAEAGTGGVGNHMPGFIRITRSSSIIGSSGIAGVQGGFAPLNASLLVPKAYMGLELDYVEKTSNTSITATTEATADTIVTANALTFDGSTAIMIEFFAEYVRPDTAAAGRQLTIWLYDGASSIGAFGFYRVPNVTGANGDEKSAHLMRRLTPSNATHTYSIRASVSVATGLIGAGAGGSGADIPAFIRITRA